jgi:hypothetical protein
MLDEQPVSESGARPLVALTKPWLIHMLDEAVHRYFLAHVAVRAAVQDRHILTALHPIELHGGDGHSRRLSLQPLIEALSYPDARAHLLESTLDEIRSTLIRSMYDYVTSYATETKQTPRLMSQPWYFYLRVAHDLTAAVVPDELVRFGSDLTYQLAKHGLDEMSVRWESHVITAGDPVHSARLHDLACVQLWTEVAGFAESSELA